MGDEMADKEAPAVSEGVPMPQGSAEAAGEAAGPSTSGDVANGGAAETKAVKDEGVEGAAAGSTAAAADSKPSSSEEEEEEGGDEIMELSHPMGRLKSVEELKAESAVPTRQRSRSTEMTEEQQAAANRRRMSITSQSMDEQAAAMRAAVAAHGTVEVKPVNKQLVSLCGPPTSCLDFFALSHAAAM